MIIDRFRLLELRDEIGGEVLSDVMLLFQDEADDMVAGLISGRFAPSEIADRLHFLKGSAINLGLCALASLCQEGERRAFTGEPQPVDGARLRQIYDASKDAFQQALRSLGQNPGPG